MDLIKDFVKGRYTDNNFTLDTTLGSIYRSFTKELAPGTYTFSLPSSNTATFKLLRKVVDGEYSEVSINLPTTFTVTQSGLCGFSFQGTWKDSTVIKLKKHTETTADRLIEVDKNIEHIYSGAYDEAKRKFWGAIQNNGASSGANYHYAFCYNRFNDDNFEPVWNIICSTGNSTSIAIFFANTVITDTKVPIYFSNNAQSCFYGCTALKTIKEIKPNTQTAFDYTFYNCTALENIAITSGSYICKNVDFSACPLTKASVINVVNALQKTTGTARTIIFKASAVNKAFETSEGANDGSTSDEWKNLIAPFQGMYNWAFSLV